MLRWTKGGYFIHSRREKGGVVVKRAGAVVYRLLALSPDGIIFPIRCKLALDAAATRAIRATAVQFNAAASYCAAVAWRVVCHLSLAPTNDHVRRSQ